MGENILATIVFGEIKYECGRRGFKMKDNFHQVLGTMLATLIMISLAGGQCPAGGCGSGDLSWQESAQAFLSSDAPIVGMKQNQNFEAGSFKAGEPVGGAINTTIERHDSKASVDYVEPESRTALYPMGKLLKSMDSISSSAVIADVSNQRSKGDAHIRGAINIPSKRFLADNGTLRNVSELTEILGTAGITDQDALIVYSDTFRSGESTFVLWMLRYLGHDDVKALDGGLDSWIAASLPLETKENARQAAKFNPYLKTEILADYNYVKSGVASIVDARTFQEFGNAKIPNAVFIDPEQVMENGKLKAGAELNDTFARLDRNKPVIVYANDLMRASLVWYALQLMGFDSRIYTWQDWQDHESLKI
jgi:thiosulfate/3-mercaptopyruvate sulfurtransferase